MQVSDSPAELRALSGACVATIGKYDGMHLGHQEILRQLKLRGRELGLPVVVMLSEPHPEEYFTGDAAPPRLQRFEEKVRFLDAAGVDAVLCLRFDSRLCRMLPDEFIRDILVEGLDVRALVVGEDFVFGRERTGDVALLRSSGARLGFSVQAVGPQLVEGERVSSTRVREHLAAGRCEKAATLLGRPYSITGQVETGRRLGRELGFPTANIGLGDRQLPLTGVFAVEAQLDGRCLPAVANAGYRPTVEQTERPSLEAHLLDHEEDLYGREMTLHFLHRLRPEEKFADLGALQKQIGRDVKAARAYFDRHPSGVQA